MLSRRTLLAASASTLAAPTLLRPADAATPKNAVVMAKAIDDIVGGFDPAQSYEFADNEACGNMYRKLVVPDPADTNKLVGDLAETWEVSKDGLNFTLLSDSEKKVVAQYGSLGSYAGFKIANRNTFLIDPQGKIVKVWTKVDPSHHSEEVLTALNQIEAH